MSKLDDIESALQDLSRDARSIGLTEELGRGSLKGTVQPQKGKERKLLTAD